MKIQHKSSSGGLNQFLNSNQFIGEGGNSDQQLDGGENVSTVNKNPSESVDNDNSESESESESESDSEEDQEETSTSC